jgi:hypothetical protein
MHSKKSLTRCGQGTRRLYQNETQFSYRLMFLTAAGFAAAQIQAPTSDVLGAHLNYGRGCAGCHAPHSGAYGNGAAKTADPTRAASILWGEDVGSLYGKTITICRKHQQLRDPAGVHGGRDA